MDSKGQVQGPAGNEDFTGNLTSDHVCYTVKKKKNCPYFAHILRLREIETKHLGLIDQVKEIQNQPNIQAEAWVLLASVARNTVRIDCKKQNRKIRTYILV